MSENLANTETLEIMKKSKTNFFYSSVFLDDDKRDGLKTIYAYCRLTDDIADDDTADLETKKSNLKVWKDKLTDSLNGSGSDLFFLELKKQIDKFNIPHKPFFDLIRGMETDLEKKTIKDFSDLYDYCYCVASTVGFMSIELFGYKNECIKEYAEKLGVALQLINIMRDVGRDFDEGRIYLPADEMAKFGYSAEDLKNKVLNDNFRKLMEYQYERALHYYEEAQKCLPDEDKKRMVPAMIMGRVYYGILMKIRRNNFDVFTEKVRVSNFAKFYIALSIYLRYKFLR